MFGTSTTLRGLIQALGAMKKLAIAFLLYFAIGEAYACSCVLVTPAQAKEMNDRVFVGQVTDIRAAQSPGMLAVSFRISDLIKGPRDQESVVLVPEGVASCGYGREFFVSGSTYLVFASYNGTSLETSACSPNRTGRPSRRELRVLRRST